MSEREVWSDEELIAYGDLSAEEAERMAQRERDEGREARVIEVEEP